MMLPTIEVDVVFVSVKIERSDRQLLDGSPPVIRKKPHAIDAVLEASMPHNF